MHTSSICHSSKSSVTLRESFITYIHVGASPHTMIHALTAGCTTCCTTPQNDASPNTNRVHHPITSCTTTPQLMRDHQQEFHPAPSRVSSTSIPPEFGIPVEVPSSLTKLDGVVSSWVPVLVHPCHCRCRCYCRCRCRSCIVCSHAEKSTMYNCLEVFDK